VPSKRYTLVIADRTTGIVHRFTIRLVPAVVIAALLFSLPVLIGMGARWSASAEIGALRLNVATLDTENASYRAATQELVTQISSIENAVATSPPSRSSTSESQRHSPSCPRSSAPGDGRRSRRGGASPLHARPVAAVPRGHVQHGP
jgi:hypothetical protein